MTEPGGALALVTAAVLLGALGFERAQIRSVTPWYIGLGVALGQALEPLAAPPVGEGETPMVRWKMRDGRALWWSDPHRRTALSGLHGAVDFEPTSAGVQLRVRWAPPLTPLLAGLWLAAVGLARGDGAFAVSVGAGLCAVFTWAHWRQAHRVADELRAEWERAHAGGGDPTSPAPLKR